MFLNKRERSMMYMIKKMNIFLIFSCFVSIFSSNERESLPSRLYNLDLNNIAKKNNIVPIVVIGSGPAGLTAALYGRRGGMHTVVFTGNLPGGQLTQTTYIENWPGIKKAFANDIMDGLFEQARDFGVTIIEDVITSVDFDKWPFVLNTESGDKINALSIIISTGAAPRKLGVEGELDYWGRGVSSCAVCDCHFFKDRDVAIVGGGDSAVEEAMQLAPYAKNIFILVRDVNMKATKTLRDKLEDFENIKVIYNKQVLKVLGDGELLNGLEVKDSITQEVSTMKVDGLFLAIGQNPNTELFEKSLSLNKFGYITIDPVTQETSVKGVFAAGDVEDAEYRQAIVAAAAGCKSALRAVKWLREIGLTDKNIKNLSKNYFSYKD